MKLFFIIILILSRLFVNAQTSNIDSVTHSLNFRSWGECDSVLGNKLKTYNLGSLYLGMTWIDLKTKLKVKTYEEIVSYYNVNYKNNKVITLDYILDVSSYYDSHEYDFLHNKNKTGVIHINNLDISDNIRLHDVNLTFYMGRLISIRLTNTFYFAGSKLYSDDFQNALNQKYTNSSLEYFWDSTYFESNYLSYKDRHSGYDVMPSLLKVKDFTDNTELNNTNRRELYINDSLSGIILYYGNMKKREFCVTDQYALSNESFLIVGDEILSMGDVHCKNKADNNYFYFGLTSMIEITKKEMIRINNYKNIERDKKLLNGLK